MANSVEMVSGLAPAVHCFLVWNGKKLRPMQAAHPFVPTIHVSVKDTSAFFLFLWNWFGGANFVNKTGSYVLFRQDPTQLKLEADEPSSGGWICPCVQTLRNSLGEILTFKWHQLTKIKSFFQQSKNHVTLKIWHIFHWGYSRADGCSSCLGRDLRDNSGSFTWSSNESIILSFGFWFWNPQGYPEMIWFHWWLRPASLVLQISQPLSLQYILYSICDWGSSWSKKMLLALRKVSTVLMS